VFDFDSDGVDDLICSHNRYLDPGTDNTHGLVVLTNNGNFTFSRATSVSREGPFQSYTNRLMLGDVNGDGLEDVVALDSAFIAEGNYPPQHNTIVSYIRDGNEFRLGSSFITYDYLDLNRIYESNRAFNAELSDLNNDGILDVIVLVGGPYETPEEFVSVHLGDGAGGFSESGIHTVLQRDNFYLDFKVVDIDNDGNMDLIFGLGEDKSTGKAGGVSILLGAGDGTFPEESYYGDIRVVHSMVVADFDQDTLPDIAIATGWDYGRIVILSARQDANTFQENVTCEFESSDADGDGWGWENNTSCLITDDSKPDGTQITINLIPRNPSVPLCVSDASDSDSDGWGWENGASCQVASMVIAGDSENPDCQSDSSDSDGDGWGWENGRSCVVGGGGDSSTD